MSDITEFKWLDPECGHDGCQSLVWKQRLERAEELADKYKWQVIDTCTRAEKAERERDELLARQDRNEKAMDIIDRAAKLLEAELEAKP